MKKEAKSLYGKAKKRVPSSKLFKVLGTFFIDKGKLRPNRAHQCFARSSDVKVRNEVYAEVVDGIFKGERTIEIDGIRFLIIVCGENNFLRNEKKTGYEAKLRHEVSGQSLETLRNLDHDILFNPAHTQYKRLWIFRERWRALSLPQIMNSSRLAISVANTNTNSLKSSINVFENGVEKHPEKNALNYKTLGWFSSIINLS